jgi:hypothetical protein
MSVGSASLPDDLLRCRRLVAAMRVQVLAPSRKRQVLQQLVVSVSRNHEQQQTKWWANEGLLSPRSRYLRCVQRLERKVLSGRFRATNASTQREPSSPHQDRPEAVAQTPVPETHHGESSDGAEVAK